MVSRLCRTHGSTESAAQHHLKTLLLINTYPEQNLGLFKRSNTKARATSDNQDTSAKPKPTGKQNPVSKLRKSRLANADIEFECDTSISLSDTDLIRKTPSPKKQAPKILDTKKTPEEFDQQCRRSTRNRTSALAGKLGNVIPISTIEAQNIEIRNVVCQVEIIPTPENITKDTNNITPQQDPQEVISLSSSVECVEIQLESDTPENIRACIQQKDTVPKSPTRSCNQKDTPTQACDQTDSTKPAASQQRAMSSIYVIDRPPQATTPNAIFLKNFDSAMKILKEILPIKNSMTFLRERENTLKSLVDNLPSSTDTADILPKTSTGDKTVKKM